MLITTSRYAKTKTKKKAQALAKALEGKYCGRGKKNLKKLLKLAEKQGHFSLLILQDDGELQLFAWLPPWAYLGKGTLGQGGSEEQAKRLERFLYPPTCPERWPKRKIKINWALLSKPILLTREY